jgi:hypothetical protein
MTTIDRWKQSADAFSSRVDAIGADESLPPELVEACHSWLQALPPEVIRAPGRYGDPRPVGSDADAQTKMLAFAGRNP